MLGESLSHSSAVWSIWPEGNRNAAVHRIEVRNGDIQIVAIKICLAAGDRGEGVDRRISRLFSIERPIVDPTVIGETIAAILSGTVAVAYWG
jgi:hypothetical protein